jgi:guanylate kinase
MSLGPLIIVSGPAGSGKTTLIRRALQEFGPRLRHSVSATTRPPRGAEVDGEDYHFWTRDRFEQGIAAGEFLEYATVFGRDYYGTLRSEVDRYREQGVGVIVDVDVQGAEQLRVTCPGAFSVFVETPPGQYERRLRARGTESDESIRRRLETARLEVARAGEFDRRILNDDVDRAAAELSAEIRRLFEANEGRSTCSRS